MFLLRLAWDMTKENDKKKKDKGQLIHVATAAKHWTNPFYLQGS